MNIFKSILNTVKPTIKRFPTASICTIASALFFSLSFIMDDITGINYKGADIFLNFGESTAWMILFSINVQLIVEIATAKKGTVAGRKILFIVCQCLCAIISFGPGYLFCKHLNDSYFILKYFGTLLIHVFALPFLLIFSQNKKIIVAHFLCKLLFASWIGTCVGIGGSIILWAVTSLIHDFTNADVVYEVIWICSTFIFGVFCFIGFVTEKDESYNPPKAFQIIFEYVLLPLYTLLLIVLYMYLFKCVIVKRLPEGQINWFVSFATALYLLFYFSLMSYENKLVSIFYKLGALLLIPLLVIQMIAFGIRVSAYGLTPVRCASLFYIIISIWFVIMSLVKHGKHMFLVFPMIAIIIFVASVTPCNVIDLSIRNQTALLKQALVKNNMFDGTKIIPSADEGSKISNKDKEIIVSTYKALYSEKNKPAWLKNAEQPNSSLTQYDFNSIFGFVISDGYGTDNKDYSEVETCCIIKYDGSTDIDIDRFREMHVITTDNDVSIKKSKITITYKKSNYDITDVVNQYLVEIYTTDKYQSKIRDEYVKEVKAPITICEKDGTTIFITNLIVDADENKQNYSDVEIKGFICR